MPAQVLTDLANQVQKNVDAEASAVTVLNGLAARIQAAVDAATANGASAAELAPITDEVSALKNSADALGAAIVASTPAA